MHPPPGGFEVIADGMILRMYRAILGGMESGASDRFAESAAHWLATYLLSRTPPHCERPQRPPDVRPLVDRRLQDALDLMRNRISEKIKLEDIASSAGMSKFHLTRVFKETFGDTPYAYLAHLRLDAARTLLESSETSVKAVASLCGYKSHGVFTAAFSRRFGCSPTEWRTNRPG